MYLYHDMVQPLAVIAPAVPTLFTVLGPIILVVAFTFLVAIPRWFLMFAHWLWIRTAPRALRERSIPGVRCETFEGVVTREFVDKYAFSVQDRGDLASDIRNFFARRGAKPADGGETLNFLRGHRLCTYFLPHLIPWREKDFFQRITVNTEGTPKGDIRIHVHYLVQARCMLRLQPAGLQREVGELYSELSKSV